MCLAQGIVNADLTANKSTKLPPQPPLRHHQQHHHQQHRNIVNESLLMDYTEPQMTSTPYNHIYKRSISMVGNPNMTGNQRRQIKILVKAR